MKSIPNAVRDIAWMLRTMAGFLWRRKAWWLAPVIVVLLLVICLIVLAQTPLGPFLYTLF